MRRGGDMSLIVRRAAALAAVVMWPLLAGWQGGGSGRLQWTAGRGAEVADGAEIAVDAAGRFAQITGKIVHTLALPGDDGVLTLTLPTDRAQGRGVTLPDSEVRINYTEYSANGDLTFEARRVVAGYVRLSGEVTYDDYLALSYDLEVEGADGSWRRLELDRLNIRPAVRDSDGDVPGASADATVWDGCSSWWVDDDSDEFASEEDSGCGGDDLSESYEESEPETSGCAGDDIDSGADDPGADCESCDGDAVAAVRGQRLRRSPWPRRVVRWLPWLSIFFAIHWMRTPGRRQRRRWRRAR